MAESLLRTAVTTFRSVALLSGGAVLGQLITAAVSPLLTRLFEPADFGALGLFTSFMLVASVGLSLRYDTAVPTPRSDHEAARLTVSALLIVVPVATLTSLIYAALILAGVAGFGGLPWWTAAAMPIGLVAFGAVSVLRYWAIRRGTFGVIAELSVVQSGGRAATQVFLGVAGVGAGGLMAGEVVGRVVGIARLIRTTLGDISVLVERWWAPKEAFALLARYRAFPLFGLPSSLLNALALYLPVPVTVALYGPEAAGALLVVQRVVTLPLAVIGSSVADVFHSRAARAASRGETLHRLAAHHAAIMFLIGLVPTAALVALARPLFPVIFGPEWVEAGVIATAMAPWALAQFVTYPLSRAVLVLEAQRLKLAFDAVSLVAVVVALPVARRVLELDAVEAISLLALVQALLYVGLLALLWHIVSRPPRSADHGS